MRSANEKKMFDLLLDEIEETLQDIEQRCLKLETSDQKKEMQIIFRAAHNVKGASQLYGLNEFGALVHILEDLLSAIQNTSSPISSLSVDVLLNAQSFLRSWLMVLRENETHVPDTSLIKQTLLNHIKDLKRPSSPAKLDSSEMSAKLVALTSTEQNQPPKKSSLNAEESPKLNTTVVPQKSPGASRKRNKSTLRIPSEKIDEVMQLIGELSIHQGILWHNFQIGRLNSLTCKDAVVLNRKTLKSLYDVALTLRMQPAESLFQRLERTARDLAREQSKKLNIELLGADTPIDKTVIELISDPLMHLIRNAIDHGIEDENTRSLSGKSHIGRLTIETHQDSGFVIISISDDGRGLDPEKIYKKAIQKGLVSIDQKLKEEDLYQFIFLPGFSTRENVTEVSGRGIGMDVVKIAIDQIGGRIEIHNTKKKGCTFTVSLPASLEIIDGILVRVADQTYIVPRQEIEEILDLDMFEIEKTSAGSSAIRLRKAIVPVESLVDYIGVPQATEAEQKTTQTKNFRQNTSLLIRLQDGSRLALRVDEVIQQQQIVVRPLSENLNRAPGFTGVSILGDGEPALILSTAIIGEKFLRWINQKSPNEKDCA